MKDCVKEAGSHVGQSEAGWDSHLLCLTRPTPALPALPALAALSALSALPAYPQDPRRLDGQECLQMSQVLIRQDVSPRGAGQTT
jgi:hypothetical protein